MNHKSIRLVYQNKETPLTTQGSQQNKPKMLWKSLLKKKNKLGRRR